MEKRRMEKGRSKKQELRTLELESFRARKLERI